METMFNCSYCGAEPGEHARCVCTTYMVSAVVCVSCATEKLERSRFLFSRLSVKWVKVAGRRRRRPLSSLSHTNAIRQRRVFAQNRQRPHAQCACPLSSLRIRSQNFRKLHTTNAGRKSPPPLEYLDMRDSFACCTNTSDTPAIAAQLRMEMEPRCVSVVVLVVAVE